MRCTTRSCKVTRNHKNKSRTRILKPAKGIVRATDRAASRGAPLKQRRSRQCMRHSGVSRRKQLVAERFGLAHRILHSSLAIGLFILGHALSHIVFPVLEMVALAAGSLIPIALDVRSVAVGTRIPATDCTSVEEIHTPLCRMSRTVLTVPIYCCSHDRSLQIPVFSTSFLLVE